MRSVVVLLSLLVVLLLALLLIGCQRPYHHSAWSQHHGKHAHDTVYGSRRDPRPALTPAEAVRRGAAEGTEKLRRSL